MVADALTGVAEHAPAKLNLALHVRGRRADGYHEIETLFAFAAVGDELSCSVEPAASFALDLEIVGPFAPALAVEPDNLVLRAARLLQSRAGPPAARYRLRLDKRLPVASGLGGGSADAAAALRLLNRLWAAGLSVDELAALGAEIGSDVPACVHGRPLLGRGRGEKLSAIGGGATRRRPLLIVNPGISVGTGAIFAAWDGIDRGPLAEPVGADPVRAGSHWRNDLEPGAVRLHPVIGRLRALLDRQQGVRLARMSGSGASCFALFDEPAACARAAAHIRSLEPGWWMAGTSLDL